MAQNDQNDVEVVEPRRSAAGSWRTSPRGSSPDRAAVLGYVDMWANTRRERSGTHAAGEE